MNSSRGLLLKTYLFLLIIILAAPVGNVLLSRGMKQVGPVTRFDPVSLWHFGLRTFSSPFIWLGIGSLITFFVAYTLVLSWADYSFVQPASSLAYGVTTLLAYFMLRESITPLRWAGVAIICLGVFIVGHTHPQSETPREKSAGGAADSAGAVEAETSMQGRL